MCIHTEVGIIEGYRHEANKQYYQNNYVLEIMYTLYCFFLFFFLYLNFFIFALFYVFILKSFFPEQNEFQKCFLRFLTAVSITFLLHLRLIFFCIDHV